VLDATDNLRIRTIAPLSPPIQIMAERPSTEAAAATVTAARRAVHQILHAADDRLVVIIGPCSIHDPAAALDYAARLQAQRKHHRDDLEIIMRVYFEKPRTTVGWKGLINDPMLDGSFQIDHGLRIARTLLLDINSLGVPAGCEFLDVITPQYIADLVSWGAIGARTTESQVHREMASGLSCPVGFKNGTDGGIRIALDAVEAASHPHHFLAVTKDGRSAIAATTGNEDCHVILRGGHTPNYDAASVATVSAEAARSGLVPRIMIDASHANSGKNPDNQPHVIDAIAQQVAAGDRSIIGVMAESNLVRGRQTLAPGQPLTYGQSITDGCIDWAMSAAALETLALAVQERRRGRAA
jgi:3-deoxy-7-phosphoheptulonate synthase